MTKLSSEETRALEAEEFEATELSDADLEDVAGGDPENGSNCTVNESQCGATTREK